MKYLLVLLVVAVAVWMLTTKLRQGGGGGGRPGAAKPPAPKAMTRCAHCGVHLPEADAVVDGARAYCSEAHRLAGPDAAADR